MKKHLNNLFFGKNTTATVLILLAVFAFVGLGCRGGRNSDTQPIQPTSNTTQDSSTTGNTPFSGRSESGSGETPSNSETDSLIKQTIGDFADAVEQGDFTSFHAQTSKDFQATYNASQLNTTFQTFIEKKAQVLPSLNTASGATVNYSDGPRVRTEKGYKILVANGTLSTRPYPVQFETEYELEDGDWKILKIKVKM